MFALEITFRDGVSQPEMVFIRRPQAVIGSSESAHVVVEDLKDLGVQLRLVRDLGRRFRCKPLGVEGGSLELSSLLEGVYEGECSMDLGPVKFQFTALDSDLLFREGEPPDRAGVRILRQACATPGPLFPAVAVGGTSPMVISFVPDQPIYIGRTKQCALRIDLPDISGKHARLGFESGEFWIEDLGSTNGTFVNQQQISGRVNVAAGVPIRLGREVTLVGIVSAEQLDGAVRVAPAFAPGAAPDRKYPVLISVSEVARPARMVIHPGSSITVGRDPSSDLWLGAPHVSRKHCVVGMTPAGAVIAQDFSTNGTAHDRGILHKGDELQVGTDPTVFDFGGGVTVGICFDAEQERVFVGTQGAPTTFRTPESFDAAAALDAPRQPSYHEAEPSNSSLHLALEHGAWLRRFSRFYSTLKPLAKMSIMLMFSGVGVLLVVMLTLFVGWMKS